MKNPQSVAERTKPRIFDFNANMLTKNVQNESGVSLPFGQARIAKEGRGPDAAGRTRQRVAEQRRT
jgi:hypothetical protein